MTVTNEEIMQCMRDLLALWRQGKLMTAEALPHAQYVVGGYLVLTSGHGGLTRGVGGEGDLETAIAEDPNLSAAVDEFLAKEAPNRPRSASGIAIPKMDFLLQVLIEYILRWLKDRA